MNKSEILPKLDKSTFFSSFSPEEKEILAELDGITKDYRNGQYIVREGEVDATIFVLLSGEVSLTKNSMPGVEIKRLKEGGMFGAFALVEKAPRTSSVTARGLVTVLRINDKVLDEFDPKLIIRFKDQLIKLLIAKIEGLNQSLLSVHNQFNNVVESCEFLKGATEDITFDLPSTSEKK